MTSDPTSSPDDGKSRIERDSLGDVRVPVDALYGAQTQRAVENFRISQLRFPPAFIESLALIKKACASVNERLGLLDAETAASICAAAEQVEGWCAQAREGASPFARSSVAQFPLDIFQTGSGTSTNMNMNEVIGSLASQKVGRRVHPNDQVNRSQSSNDVIPTTIHVSSYREVQKTLLPALERLANAIERKASEVEDVVKTGRTHLMDALPIRLSQELRAWREQILECSERIRGVLPRLAQLPLGGTAVGTGVNAPPEFGPRAIQRIAEKTGQPFTPCANQMAAMGGPYTAVELSGSMKTLAVALMKISNDLRWMNSGPNAGLGEISLPALQPGSSIMPGKVNPVIPEAVVMACAQVIGNDAAITVAGQSGSFQLNTMLPLIAYNLLQSIELLANSALSLAERAISDFEVRRSRIAEKLEQNPILATALAPRIGYDLAAQIVHKAEKEQRSIRDVAAEMSGLSRKEIDELLDPLKMTGSRD